MARIADPAGHVIPGYARRTCSARGRLITQHRMYNHEALPRVTPFFHLSFRKKPQMVDRPAHLSKFEFVTLSSLRAVQLLQGSVPRITTPHKRVIIAQMEVAHGLDVRSDNLPTLAVLPD